MPSLALKMVHNKTFKVNRCKSPTLNYRPERTLDGDNNVDKFQEILESKIDILLKLTSNSKTRTLKQQKPQGHFPNIAYSSYHQHTPASVG